MKKVKIALLNSYRARNEEFEKKYRQQAEEMGVEIEIFSEEYNKDGQEVELAEKLVIFKPRFVITNFPEENRFHVIHLTKEFQKKKQTKKISVIVCSFIINDTDFGRKNRDECLNLPGVVGAYYYSPSGRQPLPSLVELLKLKQKERKR